MKCKLIWGCTLTWLWLLGVLPMAAPLYAATTITVTTTDDALANDALCSLREAVIAANTDSPVGGCAAGSGEDTIVFDPALPKPAVFTLNQVGSDEDSAQTGDLDLAGTITINPTGSDPSALIIDGAGTDRVFEILSGAHITIAGLTIRNGNPGDGANGGGVLIDLTARLTLTDTQVISNCAPTGGGGIHVLGGLTMSQGTVASNQGGGISNMSGLVTLNDVQVINNRGGYGLRNQNQGVLTVNAGMVGANQGGGVYNGSARATLTDLAIVSNTVGGGVYNGGPTLTRMTISHSLVMSNSATNGGGILNEGVGASTTIYASRIISNLATNSGGGIFNNGILTVNSSTLAYNRARAGGGLHHFGGNLSLTNSTISQNDATDNGGGLYNGGSAVLSFATLNANQADGDGGNLFNDEAQLSIESSLVAQAHAGGNCFNSDGFLTSLGYNLESSNTCNFTATGDLINVDPLLGPLQNNGGPTPTHALLDGSAALDHGSAICPATDQRGVVRPQGLACDSGAYEFATIADLAITASVAPPTVTAGARVTYTLTISNLGPADATALTLTDELPNGGTFIAASIDGGACGFGNQVTCTLPALTAGVAATVTIVATAPVTIGAITNTAAITAATADLNLGNNHFVTVIAVTLPAGDLTPPGPVGSLTATAITTQGATLTWTPAIDNVGVAGYRVLAQKDGASQPPFLVGLIDAKVTTYTVTTLASDTSYQLWVIAYDLAGNDALMTESVPVAITTLSPLVGMVEISIEPPLPTVQDAISVTISGRHSSSCTPQYQAHHRIGYLITIESMPSPEPICLPAEFSWNYTIGLGLLEAGRYTVTHTLDTQIDTAVFTVTTAAPGAPILQVDEGQANQATVGELFQFVVKATGTPPPTYALQQAPPGMTIDAISGQLTWLPSAAGTVTVIVQAANQRGSATYTFQLAVQLPALGPYSSFLPLVVNG